MKLRKDLIVVALATFCLTATVFMTRPTLSNPGTTNRQAVNQWTDINDDGTVNILDAILLSNDYLATTDPVKNVNVTNFPSQQNVNVTNFPSEQNVNVTNWPTAAIVSGRFNITWYEFGAWGYTILPDLAEFTTAGYSRMTIQLSIVDWYPQPSTLKITKLTAFGAVWTIKPNAYTYPDVPLSDNATISWDMSFPPDWSYNYGMTSKTTEIIGSQFSLEFQVASQIQQGSVIVDIYVYMRNE
jgi:hypothetical protein